MKIFIIVFGISFSTYVHGQTIKEQPFYDFIQQNMKLPDTLKYSCEWVYAVVLVKTDARDKITGYKIISESHEEIMKKCFAFLKGYRFPKTIGVKARPVAFYYSADNRDVCKPEPYDSYPFPDDVLNTISRLKRKIKDEAPNAMIINALLTQSFYAKQE